MNLLIHERPAQPYAPDLYEVLGALRSDDFDTLRLKYRRLSRLYHPDTSFQSDSVNKFQRIRAAYGILSNPGKRELYDEFGQIPKTDEELDKEAGAVLIKMIDGLFAGLEGCDETNFETVDPIMVLKNKAAEEAAATKANREKERSLCRKLNKILERLTRKGNADNVIGMVTRARIAQSKANQFGLSTALLIWAKVDETLQSYDYKLPPKPLKRRVDRYDNNAAMVDALNLLFTRRI